MILINVKVLICGSYAYSLLWNLRTDYEAETPRIFDTVPSIVSMYEVTKEGLKDIVKILQRRKTSINGPKQTRCIDP